MDRTAPAIVSHLPPADATDVPRDRPLVIEFSEEMDRHRTEAAVFLAPRGRVESSWSGRRLQLEVEGGLAADRTYVVTVGADARDLRGNGLEQSFSYAFATGARLDSGRVEGRVVADCAPERGAFVWAYDLQHFVGRAGSVPPAYVTQSGTDGRYRFERLAHGRYRVIAFQDENRNQQPDPDEPLALPWQDAEVGEQGVADMGDGVLVPRRRLPRVLRATAPDRNRVLLVFAGEVDPAQVSVDLGPLQVRGVYAASEDGRRVAVITADQEPGRSYRVRVRVAGGQVDGPDEPVRGSDRQDQHRPRLVAMRPTGEVTRADSLVLVFDEAMDTTAVPGAADWGDADARQAPAGVWRWCTVLTLAFCPDVPPAPGPRGDRVILASLRDLSGQAPADTAATFSFTVLPEADRCALSGTAPWPAAGPVRVVLLDGKGNATRATARADGAFSLDDLAPGQYRLFAYLDRDGDGEHGEGQLDPFAPAEPYALHGEVRLERGQKASVTVSAAGGLRP